MEHVHRRERVVRGFTLAEALVVLAVIAVLLALAVPNVLVYARSLKLAELDDSARTIFLAAQNRLTALKIARRELAALGDGSVDFHENTGLLTEKLLYAEKSARNAGEGTADILVPPGSIDAKLRDNNFAVEFDPATGAVYAVWIWEGADFDYEKDAYASARPEREQRLAARTMVGYYGGTSIERASIGQMPVPAVTIVNAEELLLEISVPYDPTLPADADSHIAVTVSVAGTEIISNANIWQGHTGAVALDTLREDYPEPNAAALTGRWRVGRPFAGWDIPGLNPGEDVEVCVTLSYRGGGYLPRSVYATVNSLYAAREGDTAFVAFGRHLQNLGVPGTTVTSAVQTGDIDFEDNIGSSGPYSWLDTYGERPFVPVNAPALTAYDGGGHAVRHLNAVSEAGDAGLFAYLTGRVEGLTLTDARARGAGSAGALAGRAEKLAVTDCAVLLTAPTAEARITGKTAGGLIGEALGGVTVTNSFASTTVSGAATGGSAVGGLLGSAGDAVIVRSYAAGTLTGTGTDARVGGLAADAEGATLRNSYAAGIVAGGGTVAGLVAEGSVTVSDDPDAPATYAAVRYGKKLQGVSVTGTFPGDTGDVRARYATQGSVRFGPEGESGLPALTDSPEGSAAPYRLSEETANLPERYPYQRVVTREGELLPHYGDWLEEAGDRLLLAYYERYTGGTYGLYAVKLDGEGRPTAALDTLLPGTPGAGETVREDGYVLLSLVPLTDASCTVDGVSYTLGGEDGSLAEALAGSGLAGYLAYPLALADSAETIYRTLEIEGPVTGLFLLDPGFACEAFDVTEAPEGSWSASARLLKPGVLGSGTGSVSALIRSPRHLTNMAAKTRDPATGAAGWTFTQLMDVDYESYALPGFLTGRTPDARQAPAQLYAGGSFNGRGYQIRNLYVGGDEENVGLFGTLSGGALVRSVRLVNVDVEATAENANVGGLAGLVEGSGTSVKNCGVYASDAGAYGRFAVTSEGETGSVGGLIGSLTDSAVTGCFASVSVSGAGDASVGGFAGRMAGSGDRIRVENCYSGGQTVGGEYVTPNVSGGTGDVGGFVGSYRGGVLSGVCYSTCSVASASPDGDSRGLFAGSGDVETSSPGDTLYATGRAFYRDGSGALSEAGARDEGAYLKTGLALPGGSLTKGDTHSYDPALTGAAYPYASATGEHVGDWAVYPAEGVFYWELEEGAVHYYVLASDGLTAAMEDGLCREHDCAGTVAAWGYGVFYGTEEPGTDEDARPEAAGAVERFLSTHASARAAYSVAPALPGTDAEGLRAFPGHLLPSGEKFVMDTRFAAALGIAKGIDETGAVRREIRTPDQLENVAGNGGFAFTQSHDIDINGGLPATLRLTGGTYDGGFYRLLDLGMDNAGGDAALFQAVEDGATVKNVILYAPGGDGSISGGNAAGIAGSLRDSTLESCVVSGYTLTGRGAVGGLAATVSGASAITGCETTVTLRAAAPGAVLGGLAGRAEGALAITQSYAGGGIAAPTGIAASSAGGLVGAGEGVAYRDVYSTMDMTDAVADTVYGIGPGTVSADSRISEYWFSGLPAGDGSGSTADTDPAILGVALPQLKRDCQKLGFAAEEVYIPGSEGRGGLENRVRAADDTDERKYARYPFAAFVTDRTEPEAPRNLHYGAFPAADCAGLFYYEIENITRLSGGVERTETVTRFYAHGGEIAGSALRGQKLLDGLCYDHHLNGERARIVEWGYGYFYPDGADETEAFDYAFTSSDGPISGETELSDSDPIKTGLLKSLDVDGQYKVYTVRFDGADSLRARRWTLTATRNGANMGEVSVTLVPAFGAAISADPDLGRGEDAADNFLQIRARKHLENALAAGDGEPYDYYAVTHDIDLTGEDWTPGGLSASVFDGGGYRILDMRVRAGIAPEEGGAGLFTTTRSGAVIRNVVLYAPGNTGLVANTHPDGSAGGIVGKAGEGLTLSNCAVSGYTVTGGGDVGGLVGTCGPGEISIDACEADAALTSTAGNAGGVAGSVYAGSITRCVVSGSRRAEGGSAGELYGKADAAVLVTGSYAVADALSDEQLADEATRAHYTFIPSADPFEGLTAKQTAEERYPYRTYLRVRLDPERDAGVTEAGDYRVHYGDWPRSLRVAGVLYWELDGEGAFTYHLLGLTASGESAELHGGLCTSRHVDETTGEIEEHPISATGYALVNALGEAARFTSGGAPVTALPGLEAGSAADIERHILAALNLPEDAPSGEIVLGVYPTPEDGDCETHAVRVSVGAGSRDIYYTRGFADVSPRPFGVTDQSGGRVYPLYIRTLRQLDNIPDDVPATVSFLITHDLYGGDYGDGYEGAANFHGSLDGDGRKVLELTVRQENAGLLASAGDGAKIENLILWSPTGSASLTGGSAGGIAARLTGGVTIANCAVAGYTISGTGSLGGLVGHLEGEGAEITSCEAVNILESAAPEVRIGGLLGSAQGSAAIENCYAGGRIAAGETSLAGGLVGGESGGVAVADAYSYVDLTGALGEKSATGRGIDADGSVCYLTAYAGGAEGPGTGLDLFELAEQGRDVRAEWSYRQGRTPTLRDNNGFCFRAVLTVEGRREHYGDWPALAGIMYWELDEAERFTCHFIGLDENGTVSAYSNLCQDHHTANGHIVEHKLLQTGYAQINTDAAVFSFTRSGEPGADISDAGAGLDVGETQRIEDALSRTLGIAPAAVALTPELADIEGRDNGRDFTITVTARVEGETRTKEVHYTLGLAEVSETAFGTAENPFLVRTLRQLRNISTPYLLQSYAHDAKFTIAQGHDLYGEGETFTPLGSNLKALGMGSNALTNTYDGRGYRILELNIVSANNHAALFYELMSGVVRNVILYSPSGTATITAEYDSVAGDPDSLNAAGISADALNRSCAIENCVVAGYTINAVGGNRATGPDGAIVTHDHYIGGIAGWFSGTITNCAASVNIDDADDGSESCRAFIGGILGGTNGAAVSRCCAGGNFSRTSGAGHGMAQYVGGIVGAQESNNRGSVTSCYSYVDMSDLISTRNLVCTLYSISPNGMDTPVNNAGSGSAVTLTNNYYWSGGIYGTEMRRGTESGVTGVDLESFKAPERWQGSFTAVTAGQTFLPANVRHLHGEAYPFGATTVDVYDAATGDSTPTAVHYGVWPFAESPAVAAAYWEYEIPQGVSDTQTREKGAYRYQGFGFSVAGSDDAPLAFDNLCTLHDGGDTRASGFVYFYLPARTEESKVLEIIGAAEKSGLTPSWDPALLDSVTASLRRVFGKYYAVVVFESAGSGEEAAPVAWTLADQNASGTADGTGSRSMSVAFDPRFSKLYLPGELADGSETRPYIVRSITQFMNMETLMDKKPGRLTFEQTHDLECAGFEGYAPMEVSDMTYRGHVYSVRNLRIQPGESAADAALFAKAKNVTLDGLVLEVPAANDQLTALPIAASGPTASGIAAVTEGDCAFIRCAVAGYDITSHGTVGGLVGVNRGSLTLTNCEAVYNPTGIGHGELTTIGGLVGENRGDLALSNTYAGGKIFAMAAEAYHVGGLVGRNSGGSVRIDHSYTYMDMSELAYDGKEKLVYALAPSGVDWETCRYAARGVPAWTAWASDGDGNWVKTGALGCGFGLPLYDSVVNGVREGETEARDHTVATGLGSWLRARSGEAGWHVGKAENRALAEFPFAAVITCDEDDDRYPGGYVHFGHNRYASFGSRPTIGFFQVYGTSGGEAGLNPNEGPYYAFGWVRDVEGVIGIDSLTGEDYQNLGNITRTQNGAKRFLPHRATAYGLLLPEGCAIEDTGVTTVKSHDNIAYDTGLPWVEHNYRVMDSNGNVIIGDFAVEARDGKPFEIETRDTPDAPYEPHADPGTVSGRDAILKEQVSKVALQNAGSFAGYELYWFTTSSVSGVYEDAERQVSRSRTEFRLEFTFNYAEETIYHLPDPDTGGYPLTHVLTVESRRKTSG